MKILDKSNNNILNIKEKEQANRMLRYPDKYELVEEKKKEKKDKEDK